MSLLIPEMSSAIDQQTEVDVGKGMEGTSLKHFFFSYEDYVAANDKFDMVCILRTKFSCQVLKSCSAWVVSI